ncbi:TetR/AcrR family transcriptional regulator [Herbiconiux sp.]|uniref:TetR/AcrR family transcriptional regulator n=1 Tax=Herbiconiux sp. TaxID=1871186 RepID=UPI0025BEB096|nr:TetR/AcrR family transcriptional regulator [Herbiconiux sp.]
MTTTGSRTRTGSQLRDELLAAATDLLSERLAITPPSLRETARVVGVSATAVYRYFPSQQELLLAIASQSLASLEAVLGTCQDEASGGEDPVVRVRSMAVTYATWAVANPGAYQLLFEGRDLLDESARIDLGIDRLQADLESLLQDLPAGGRDKQVRAELLWTALHGLVVTRIRKTRQQWRRPLAEDAVALVDAFIS